jgi:hypothetical protein
MAFKLFFANSPVSRLMSQPQPIKIVNTCSFVLSRPRFLAAPGRVSPRRAPRAAACEQAPRASCLLRKTALAGRWPLRSVEPGWRWQPLRAAVFQLPWEPKRRETARRSGVRGRLHSLPGGPCFPWSPAGGGSGCVRLALSWRGSQSGRRPRGGAAGASGVRGIRSSSLW